VQKQVLQKYPPVAEIAEILKISTPRWRNAFGTKLYRK
jgi:hypothetical protein